MKTAIIYSSKYGTTEKVANLIGKQLDTDKVDYISLKENKLPDIQAYDKIILGTSIYAGSSSKQMKAFCNNNRELLEKKKIGLYICCMLKKQEEKQLSNAYPEYLSKIAIVKEALGGEALFDKMNVFEKFLSRKIMKVDSSVFALNNEAINSFTERMR